MRSVRQAIVIVIVASAALAWIPLQAAGQGRPVDWTLHFDEPHAVFTASSIPSYAIELFDGRLLTVGDALYRLDVDSGEGAFLPMRLPAFDGNVLAMPDGDLLTWSGFSSCRIQRLAPDGQVRWTVTSTDDQCQDIVKTGPDTVAVTWRSWVDGSAWLTGLTSRGVEAWRSDVIADVRLLGLAGDRTMPVLYLVTKRGAVDSARYAPGPVSVHAFDTAGDPLWEWSSTDQHQMIEVDADPAGGVLVDAGPLGGSQVPPTRILGFDPAGRNRSDFAVVVESMPRSVLPAPQHGAYIVDIGGVPRIRHFASDGTPVWSWSVDSAQFPGATTYGAEVDRAGAVILNLGNRIVRIKPNGEQAFLTESLEDNRYIEDVVVLADGRLFVLTGSSEFVAGVIRVHADGALGTLATIPEATLRPTERRHLWVHAGNEGSGAFVAPWVDETQSELRSVSVHGSPAWSRMLEPYTQPDYCGGDWLCVAEHPHVFELSVEDGEERWRWGGPKRWGQEQGYYDYFRRDDGGIVGLGFVLCQHVIGCEFTSIVTQLAPGGGALSADLQVDGRALAVSTDGTVLSLDDVALKLLRADGSTAQFTYDYLVTIVTRPESYERPFPLPALLHTDESATVVTAPCGGNPGFPCARDIEITRLDAAGTRWSVGTGIPDDLLSRLVGQQLLENADGSVVALFAFADPAYEWRGMHQVHLLKVSAVGQMLWRRHWTQSGAGADSAELFPVPGKNALALVWTRNGTNDPSVTTVDLPTGAIRTEHGLACAGMACDVWSVDIGTGGTLVAAGLTDQASSVMGRHALMDVPVDIALESAGLGGAWYAPRSSGQGFTIRTYPGSSTVFMPWFTFESTGGNEVDSQRWYALQGDYAPGADSMSMAIIERRGGEFDQSPADPLSIVGEAEFNLQSCDDALLDFRFTSGENEGASGVIAMQPLLPRRHACTDAEGAIRPVEALYDHDLTGSWYDPATSGQGLEIERIAPGTGTAGLLYAAWFTFVPSAANGEGNDQRWFTLQGQEAGDDGAVRTTIVQTIGGRFDADPTANTFRVGHAELVSQGCDRLTLRYTFDDSVDAGEFGGLAGEIPLQRIGACPAN